ncbi:MAG: DUF4366 domain-containing protein [Oscillospiraceae bacterium]|nr:DUF4366 domain-containing protein [Oscillospiraceae bacterium]
MRKNKRLISLLLSGAFLLPIMTFTATAEWRFDPFLGFVWIEEPTSDEVIFSEIKEEILIDEEIIFLDDYCNEWEKYGCKCSSSEELVIRNEELTKPAETTVKPKETAPVITTVPAVTTPPIVTTPPPATTPKITAPVVTEPPIIEPISDETEEGEVDVEPIIEVLEITGRPPLVNPQGGNATMIESVSSGDVDREFIAVQSKNGAVFYIIIDRDEKSDNVYFLNLVDEYDLLAFAKYFPDNYDDETASVIIEETPEEPPVQPRKKGNSMLPIVIILGGIGVFIYFKFIKNKGLGAANNQGFGYENDDEEEDEIYENESESEE